MADSPFPQLVAAVQQYKGDKYSQARRNMPGYSDCSSFIGKGLKALGVVPPGASTTLSYLSSPNWVGISRGEVGAGDILVNTAHCVIATSNTDAIGQQNAQRNVQTGPISELMMNTGGSFRCLRYRYASSVSQAGFENVGSASSLFSLPGAMVDAAKWLTNTMNWFRIGMLIAGALMILVVVVGSARAKVLGGIATGTVKKAVKS